MIQNRAYIDDKNIFLLKAKKFRYRQIDWYTHYEIVFILVVVDYSRFLRSVWNFRKNALGFMFHTPIVKYQYFPRYRAVWNPVDEWNKPVGHKLAPLHCASLEMFISYMSTATVNIVHGNPHLRISKSLTS